MTNSRLVNELSCHFIEPRGDPRGDLACVYLSWLRAPFKAYIKLSDLDLWILYRASHTSLREQNRLCLPLSIGHWGCTNLHKGHVFTLGGPSVSPVQSPPLFHTASPINQRIAKCDPTSHRLLFADWARFTQAVKYTSAPRGLGKHAGGGGHCRWATVPPKGAVHTVQERLLSTYQMFVWPSLVICLCMFALVI